MEDPRFEEKFEGLSTVKGARCVGCSSQISIRVHYGAASCHGCKAFFRRSVFESRVYVCSAENKCEISNESRNRCRACRLRNCLDGGMNPKHVREERTKIDRLPSTSVTPAPPATPSATSSAPTTSTQELSDQESWDRKPIGTIVITMAIPEASGAFWVLILGLFGKRRRMCLCSVEEHQLTQFLVALEKQTESLTDEEVEANESMNEWSRDISLALGLRNPNLIIKRTAMNWRCESVMTPGSLFSSWYRSFVLHADWALSIPDFRVLPLQDQTSLFKQNFMAFAWMIYAYKSYTNRLEDYGIPLGNGTYVPYCRDVIGQLPPSDVVINQKYFVVGQKLVDLVVRPMIECEMSEEEYCLLKTIALFQPDCELTASGLAICKRVRDRLLEALAIHHQRRFPYLTPIERTSRGLKLTLLITSFAHIGQVEATLIHNMSEEYKLPLSGVPMELCQSHICEQYNQPAQLHNPFLSDP